VQDKKEIETLAKNKQTKKNNKNPV